MSAPGEDPDEASAEGTFQIVNELGLHARAAARLVHLAATFDAEVELEKDGRRVNAKSIMGVLLLCGQRGTEVTVIGFGRDGEAAVAAIGRLIADRFGENA
ncbi:MAG: HPr family phosphocarrier protein [Deltaproteobacteria bacterium]|nr:MAG: HPr family phosphocarrier protein [Deltaproteobacteria bacterium]